jgi:hypothetical protein
VAHLAVPGGVSDAVHGAWQPAVVPFQGQREVGPVAVVSLPPPGPAGTQFPQSLLMPGPAGGQLVLAAVDPAGNQDLLDPGGQGRELAAAGGRVEVVPAGRGRATGRGRVEGVGDLPGQHLEPGDQLSDGLAAGRPVAAFQRADLAAQVAQLVAERGYCPGERLDVRRVGQAHSSGPSAAGMTGKGMVSWTAAWPLPLPLPLPLAAAAGMENWAWALMGCRTGRAGRRPSL